MLYLTADPHFGHANIIGYTDRPHKNVASMDYHLIANWNSVVKKNDVVVVAGDFTLFGLNSASDYFELLNGTIRVVPGSHDYRWISDYKRKILHDPDFQLTTKTGGSVEILPEIYQFWSTVWGVYPKRWVVICHYAMRSWPKKSYNAWHFYGHSHGRLEPHDLSMDIGVDSHNYKPISLATLSEVMKSRQEGVDEARRKHDNSKRRL
jgi:calcineurin-like phosphoesterase family protein